ncbi:hypothetical protein [Paraferrimonas sedimenticola]|uniref:DUF4177 domain-containing protein n=1 Tax=Paraferrimonas sedimenticola TaxID=375674 RepID=A0AA37W0M7_9GAMM|nr:hypothetical protein [Paraferrimonas sedimenticola]GLP98034.1 hypothetical protein GCM10007895_33410 [Paraferrimonas sedimenticola]
MRRVVRFNKTKFLFGSIDLELLNKQIEEMESEGWRVLTVTPCCHFFGWVKGYTLLIESN